MLAFHRLVSTHLPASAQALGGGGNGGGAGDTGEDLQNMREGERNMRDRKNGILSILTALALALGLCTLSGAGADKRRR